MNQLILGNIINKRKKLIVVASSGIASTLLINGRTAHATFKIPLNIFNNSICNINKNSELGKYLIETNVLIWDEAPMLSKDQPFTHGQAFVGLSRCETKSNTHKTKILNPVFKEIFVTNQNVN